jgi:hypothetical protein
MVSRKILYIKRLKNRSIVILFLCIVLGACSNRMIETNLYFGLSKPGGGEVTEEEWNRFKEEKIAEVFKEGSSVYRVTGNWLDTASKQLIIEPTYVVVYFYKSSKNISNNIDSLREWYKTTFRQQSVLRVDKKVKAGF